MFSSAWHPLIFHVMFLLPTSTPLLHKVHFHLNNLKQLDQIARMSFPNDSGLSSSDQAFVCSDNNAWVADFPLSCNPQMNGCLLFHSTCFPPPENPLRSSAGDAAFPFPVFSFKGCPCSALHPIFVEYSLAELMSSRWGEMGKVTVPLP